VKILIYGSRMFGDVVRSLVTDCGHEFAGFIDDVHAGVDIHGPFDEVRRHFLPGEYACVNAVGYNNLVARRQISQRIRAAGYATPTLVHPRSYLATSASLGPGVFVMASASIDHRVTVCSDAVIWPSAVISHDSVIGDNSFLSPACVICGDCRIGADCFIGAGAVIVSHAVVPDGSFVKALMRCK
jgi:sugar O-acyltransferase (sialic acid O-acetyltransferase NeuD family)